MVQTSNFQIINECVLAPLPALPPLHPPSPNPLTSPRPRGSVLLLPGGSCSAGGLGSLASCSLLLAYKCSLNQ